jgi:hypothetical protein
MVVLWGRKTCWAILTALGPEIFMIPMPPLPGGLAIAAIVDVSIPEYYSMN